MQVIDQINTLSFLIEEIAEQQIAYNNRMQLTILQSSILSAKQKKQISRVCSANAGFTHSIYTMVGFVAV